MIEVVVSVNRKRRFVVRIENDETSPDPNVGHYDVSFTDDTGIIKGRERIESYVRTRGPNVVRPIRSLLLLMSKAIEQIERNL